MADPTREQFEKAKARVIESAPAGLSRDAFYALIDAELARPDPSLPGARIGPAPPPPPTSFWNEATQGIRGFIPGVTQTVLHPLDTLGGLLQGNERLFNEAVDAAKQGEYTKAALTAKNYLLNPILGGERMQQIEENTRKGNYSGALGGVADYGLQIAAPAVIPKAVEATAPLRTAASEVLKTQKAARTARAVAKGEETFITDLKDAAPPSRTVPWDPVEHGDRAKPYLRAQQLETPVQDVLGATEAADNAIEGIENKVSTYFGDYGSDLIRNKPLDTVVARLKRSPRGEALSGGLKELSDLELGGDLTLTKADEIRLQLNAENRALLKKNKYNIADARKADPGFAAREAAAEALRDGIYDQLDARGIKTGEGRTVRDIRLDEGALIKIRNGLANQIETAHLPATRSTPSYAGLRTVGGKLAAGTGSGIGFGAGYYLSGNPVIAGGAGIIGAGIGAATGELLGASAQALTKDALVARAFKNLEVPGGRMPSYPTVPARPTPAGLLGPGAIPQGPVPDVSGGGARSAIPIRWAHEGGTARVVPTQFSGDPNAAPVAQPLTMRNLLGPAKEVQVESSDLAPHPLANTYVPSAETPPRYEPAAPLGHEVVETKGEGGGTGYAVRPTQYSGDIGQKAAPHVELTGDERYALYWIKENMDALPFVKQSLNFVQGRGSTLERSGGAAGAKIYEEIIGRQGKKGPANIAAGRGDVNQAITNLFEGKLTKTGEYVLDVVRDLVKGREKTTRLMDLPPPDVDTYLKFEDQAGPDVPRTQHAIDFIKSLRPED